VQEQEVLHGKPVAPAAATSTASRQRGGGHARGSPTREDASYNAEVPEELQTKTQKRQECPKTETVKNLRSGGGPKQSRSAASGAPPELSSESSQQSAAEERVGSTRMPSPGSTLMPSPGSTRSPSSSAAPAAGGRQVAIGQKVGQKAAATSGGVALWLPEGGMSRSGGRSRIFGENLSLLSETACPPPVFQPPSPGAIILFQAPFARSSLNSCSTVTGAGVTPPHLTGIALACTGYLASTCVSEVAASQRPCVSRLTERQQVIRALRI
jgi:hypothetical protein